ncbi:AAA family ATPase, partial [uncultured Leptotrichia sp.]|uniref:AAA family ATPase n=1 Tax=uncultured Leptotrichia sp. TaxID=159271 RepID=UPI0026155862
NFRAIGHAAIQISGITVVTGENSSGKSTLSKLLYYLFNTATNYEFLVKKSLFDELDDFFDFLKIIYQENKELNNIDFKV